MNNSKFKFIELPHPETIISPQGASQLVGGLHCEYLYNHCSKDKDNFCKLDPHGNGYSQNDNCNGNPLGCSGTFYCHYNP